MAQCRACPEARLPAELQARGDVEIDRVTREIQRDPGALLRAGHGRETSVCIVLVLILKFRLGTHCREASRLEFSLQPARCTSSRSAPNLKAELRRCAAVPRYATRSRRSTKKIMG